MEAVCSRVKKETTWGFTSLQFMSRRVSVVLHAVVIVIVFVCVCVCVGVF